MFSKKALRLGMVGAIAALPLSLAGIANAATGAHPSLVRPMTGGQCGTTYVADDSAPTQICTEVGGSGTYVTYVVVQISDAATTPAPSDVWFPTYAGCTVQAYWQLWNNAGNSNFNNSSAPMTCSALKGAGGWQDSPDRQMEAGELCSYVYLVQFGQTYGGNNCVHVH